MEEVKGARGSKCVDDQEGGGCDFLGLFYISKVLAFLLCGEWSNCDHCINPRPYLYLLPPPQKERDKAQADFEKKKQSIIDAGSKSLAHIDDKFSGSVTNAESVIAKETVGLVTAEEFRKIRERATRKESVGSVGDGEEEKVESKATIKKKKKKKKMMMATLSFAGGEEVSKGGRSVATTA